MASSQERALGSCAYFKLKGKTWRLSRIGPTDMAEANAFMRSRLRNPLAELEADPAYAKFGTEVQVALATEALRNKERIHREAMNPANVEAWSQVELPVFLFWRAIRLNHDEWKSDVDGFFDQFNPDKGGEELTLPEMRDIMRMMDEITSGIKGPDGKQNGRASSAEMTRPKTERTKRKRARRRNRKKG